MNTPTIQYTIRGVPDEVDQILRARAKSQNISINRLILNELSKITLGKRLYADFSDLVGQWQDDPVFDQVVAEQRRIDPADWK